jgi:hypothetical protein
MWSPNAVLKHRRGPRLFKAITAGLGALAVALFLMVFDVGLAPPSARAEAAASATVSAPARSSISFLSFHGPGGEILNFAP